MRNRKNVLVCLGLPCSGKGTQSRLLADTINAQRIESGARLDMIIRGEINPELTDLASRVRTQPKTLTQDESVLIEKSKLGGDFGNESDFLILDGFGRKMSLYEILCDTFGKDFLTFMHFKISEKTMKKRAETRWIDPNTRQSYALAGPSEAKHLGFIKRVSDSPEVLGRRYQGFQNRTIPVLKAHSESGGRVLDINAGHPDLDSVTGSMKAQLRSIFPEMFNV